MSLDLDRIKKELETLPKYDAQIALQGTKDNLDPFFSLGSYFKDKKVILIAPKIIIKIVLFFLLDPVSRQMF